MKKIIPLLAFLMLLGVNTANAEDVNSELQQLQQALIENPDDALLLNETGLALYKAGKYVEAEPLYQRSVAIWEKSLGKDHPYVATSLNNLASLYRTQGKYEQAEPLFIRSLAIRGKAYGKDHPSIANSLNNLAGLYSTQGKYEQAEPLYQRSLAIREKSLGKDHPDVALSLNNLAALYYEQGKYEQAEPLYQRSFAIWEKNLKDHHYVALSLNNLAYLYTAQGTLNKVEPLFQKSLRIKNHLFDSWLWGAGEKTRQSYLQQEEGVRNVYLSFYSLANTPEEAFYFSLSRKGLLLRISSEVSALTKSSSDPEIQKQTQEFNTLKTELSNLVFSRENEDNTKTQTLEEKINNLEMELSQKVASFKRSKIEVMPDDVLAKLKSKQSLVDFLVYTEHDFKTNKDKTEQVIALIADKQNGIKLIKLGELEPVSKLIKQYRYFPTENEIKTQKMSKDDINKFFEEKKKTLPKVAEQLYTLLWQPLTPYLQSKKTVYLIPDGDLHLLPFKALQNPDGKYLAEKWQLITLSSARDIVLPPLEGKASQAAIFAAPDYGDDTAIIKAGNTTGATELKKIHFSSLPNALKEGQQIDILFKKKQPESPAKLFLKDKATEQTITATISPKILHLATHGFFLEDIKPDEKALKTDLMLGSNQPLPQGKIENPLTRSGLAFANANLGVKGIKQNDGTDGFLTALEVLNLDLAGTDLVTLSACDTNKGDVKIGEGVYSLNRAFQEAGAKAVLSALWQVDDKATGVFMQNFYSRFLEGKPAQLAIQETQDEFMHNEKYKQYSNPFYWAGFVMMGKE